MTKQEAINKLIKIRQVQESNSEAHEALGMAIDALAYQAELPDGLDEAASKYISTYYANHHQEPDMTSLFIVGAEWQKKQDQQLIELAEDHAMLAGMNKMKEEMMENAFRCEIIKSRTHMPHLKPYFFSSDYGKIGDKVKVIVIPEEK